MKRRIASIISAVMILSLTACSSTGDKGSAAASTAAPNNASGSGSGVTLRIAWWGSQARHDATLKVLDMYSKKANVKFESEFMPFDGYFTKLNTLVASNDVYDVFQLGGNFPTYIDQLEPLDDYIKKGTVDVSNTTKSMLETTQYNGKQYGISLGTNTYGIAYDPEMFKKAGLSEPTDNWTWSEFKTDALTIKQKLGKFGSSQLSDFFAGATIGVPQNDKTQTFFNKERTGLNYKDDKFIANYLQMKYDLVKAGAYPDPGQIAEIKDIEGDYIVTGDAAMTWVASNQFIALSKAAGRTLKLATVPRVTKDGPSGMTMQSSQMFGVYSNSKHKEDAAKFVSYFVNDVDANLELKGERGVPIMSNVRKALEEKQTDSEKAVYSFVDKMGKLADAPFILDATQQPEIKDLFMRLQEQVIFGQISADEASKQLRSGAEKIFGKSK